ncbi:hypothetical protein HanPI659440_Chr07g0254061 [Helianthus annuus]|nr:hypothetical protein HanPI659440_Chr07g0254061 [Helianthus annuus]
MFVWPSFGFLIVEIWWVCCFNDLGFVVVAICSKPPHLCFSTPRVPCYSAIATSFGS